jgi:hypothetical protein
MARMLLRSVLGGNVAEALRCGSACFEGSLRSSWSIGSGGLAKDGVLNTANRVLCYSFGSSENGTIANPIDIHDLAVLS